MTPNHTTAVGADTPDQFIGLRDELAADLERCVTQRATFASASAPEADWSDVVTLTHLDHDIVQIEAAIQRIDAGVYGRCELCDARIPFGRLEVMPHTRCCVACSAE